MTILSGNFSLPLLWKNSSMEELLEKGLAVFTLTCD